MSEMSVCVIPVKHLAQAKGRLSTVLAPGQRAALVRAMLADVLHSAARVVGLAGIALLTGDETIADYGRQVGLTVIDEPEGAGLCAGLQHAAAQLQQQRVDRLLILPADVPAVTADDLERLLRCHRGPHGLTLVEAGRDGGTNALVVSPPNLMPFRFGPRSAHAHLRQTIALGLRPTVVDLPRLALDIDRPDDLERFVSMGTATHTAELSRAWYPRSETCV